MSFKITKAQVEAYVNNGFTVKRMAEDITNKSGVKCSEATIRHACSTYGINLKNKRQTSHFILEDLDEVSPSPITEAMQNGGVALIEPVEVIDEEPTVQL